MARAEGNPLLSLRTVPAPVWPGRAHSWGQNSAQRKQGEPGCFLVCGSGLRTESLGQGFTSWSCLTSPQVELLGLSVENSISNWTILDNPETLKYPWTGSGLPLPSMLGVERGTDFTETAKGGKAGPAPYPASAPALPTLPAGDLVVREPKPVGPVCRATGTEGRRLQKDARPAPCWSALSTA